MQAILTKYIGPTNTKGTRIKAECAAKSLTVSWDHSVDVQENHEQAAAQLAEVLGWGPDYGTLMSGCLPSGDYCHVFVKAAA